MANNNDDMFRSRAIIYILLLFILIFLPLCKWLAGWWCVCVCVCFSFPLFFVSRWGSFFFFFFELEYKSCIDIHIEFAVCVRGCGADTMMIARRLYYGFIGEGLRSGHICSISILDDYNTDTIYKYTTQQALVPTHRRIPVV